MRQAPRPQAAILLAVLAMFSIAGCRAKDTVKRPGRLLNASETASVEEAVALMRTGDLTDQVRLADRLSRQGVWRAATPNDVYLTAAEKAGDTPYAYTLSEGKAPRGIVLAPRFFQATPAGRASLMLHELGHYAAYVRTGKSDEFDGYKAQFDTHRRIGLTERDGLVYFLMLDGVVQYVVPRDPRYRADPEVAAFLKGEN